MLLYFKILAFLSRSTISLFISVKDNLSALFFANTTTENPGLISDKISSTDTLILLFIICLPTAVLLTLLDTTKEKSVGKSTLIGKNLTKKLEECKKLPSFIICGKRSFLTLLLIGNI